MKTMMLFRGGPINGLNVSWPYDKPPDKLTGFLTTSPDDPTIPPADELIEYHRQELFICDMAPEVRAVIYVWQRR